MYSKTFLALLLVEAMMVFADENVTEETATEHFFPNTTLEPETHSVSDSQHYNASGEEQIQLNKNGAYRYEPGTAICDDGKCDTCPKGVPLDWNRDLTTCEFYDIAWDKHEEGGWLALCKHVGYFDPIIYTIGGIRYPKWDAYNGCCAIWHKRACPPKYVAHPEELWGTMGQYLLASKYRSLLVEE